LSPVGLSILVSGTFAVVCFCGEFGTVVEYFARNFMALIHTPSSLVAVFGPSKLKVQIKESSSSEKSKVEAS
jgi:hypothetical protein